MATLVIADDNAFPAELWERLIAGDLPPLLQKRPGSAVELYEVLSVNESLIILADADALSEATIQRLRAEAGKTYAIPKKPGSSVDIIRAPRA